MIQDFEKTFDEISRLAKTDSVQAELSVTASDSFSSSYQQRQLKKYSSNQAQSATIRVLLGPSTGVASTENLSSEALISAYREALQSARDLLPGNRDELAPRLQAQQSSQELSGIFHSDYSSIPISERLKWAEILESKALDTDPRVAHVPYSGVSLGSGQKWLMNTLGLRLQTRASSISGYSYALAKEGSDSQTGYETFFFRQPEKVKPADVAFLAAQKSLKKLGAQKPKTGKWDVVFASEVMGSLVQALINHFSARNLDEGVSLLKGQHQNQVFSKLIEVIDDPFRVELPGARAFDDEGSTSRVTTLIRQGVLENFLTNTFYAEKLKLPLTAHAALAGGRLDVAPTNLVVSPGSKTRQQILEASDETLLLTELGPLHSGLKDSTLDFSLPASGFHYKQGEPVGPVHQFVVSGNLLDLFKKVTSLSNEYSSKTDTVQCPDFFVQGISVAGA